MAIAEEEDGVRDRPRLLTAVAIAIAVAVAGIVVMAAIAGFRAVGDAADHVSAGWIALAGAAQIAAYAGYVVAYRAIARLKRGPELSRGLAGRLVGAGFGAFALRGGFGLDTRALRGLTGERDRPVTRVLGLGALEWALLAPAACIAALVLLLTGSRAQGALLWSWVIAVPVGFAGGPWAAHPDRVERLERRDGWRRALGRALSGVSVLRTLAAHPVRWASAWPGLALYWVGDIAVLYAALRTFDVRVSAAVLIVAYATGYAATRRTLPLGGAGTTEALLTYSLHWVGLGLAHALAAVVVYRFFNFWLVAPPALRARKQLEPLFRGDGGDVPAREVERLLA